MLSRRAALLLAWRAWSNEILPVTEKDLREAATQKVDPEYPAVARQIRVTGDVVSQVLVDAAGNVEQVTVVSGNTLLAGASVQALKRWKFTPFLLGSEVVKAKGPIRFSFQL